MVLKGGQRMFAQSIISHSASTPSVFEVICSNMLYKLLTYLLNKVRVSTSK